METCRHPCRNPLQPFPGPAPCRHVLQASSRPHSSQETDELGSWWKRYTKKYVVLCLLCGTISIVLGIIFIVIYFILRSYTSSLQFFESIPTYVPAVVLIITGLMVTCFAKRRNRYAYLVKLAGGFCLICALLCVAITVTTTVVHMNRLQMLHECIYTPKANTCTCVSAVVDSSTQDGTHRFVFNDTPNCEVVHGSLSVCLRVLFGLSVAGILVCIFSSMLVYQLLTHEKKKLYLEQLELRRRFLYRQRSQQGFCNYCDDPWQLWEILNYGIHQQTEESGIGQMQTDNSRHRSWWPWNNGRLHDGVASRLVRYCRSGNRSAAGSSFAADSPAVSPNTNEYSNRGSQPVRFGPRPVGRHWHRRTRSNDGVFHHLHFGIQHYVQGPFLSGEVPRYMWGPPPPYSQPPSVENISSIPVEMTELPYGRRESEGLTLDTECISTHSSKISTPPSGRHFLYGEFASEGITLTISGPGFQEERRKSDDESCVVQVHVPGCISIEKREVVFNTLPTRSSRKREPSPFKSLSNIPLCLSRKLSGLADPNAALSLIETCYEVNDELCNCSLEELTHLRAFVKPPSEKDSTGSSMDFPGTILELPSDFRSSVAVATSPSTPVTENVLYHDMVYAQSMPNLSVSNQIDVRTPHRIPSSGGDTSTSRDFADFELDDDGSLVGIDSPERDRSPSPVNLGADEHFLFGTSKNVVSKSAEDTRRHVFAERPVVIVIRNAKV